jgi:hypothetical protein
MSFQEFVGSGIPALGFVFGIGWFLFQRFQSLEKRFRKIEYEVSEIRHSLDLTKVSCEKTDEALQLAVNGCRELIEHRTRRFTDELRGVEGRLGQDVSEIKGWLSHNTEFTVRDR